MGRVILLVVVVSASEDMSEEFGPEPDPTITNDDLCPTTPAQRTLSRWEMASLWVGPVVGVGCPRIILPEASSTS